MFLLFPKKGEQKSLLRREGYFIPKPRRGRSGRGEKSIGLVKFFFFQKKKQKALFCFAENHTTEGLVPKELV
jgi:hypothetical protein